MKLKGIINKLPLFAIAAFFVLALGGSTWGQTSFGNYLVEVIARNFYKVQIPLATPSSEAIKAKTVLKDNNFSPTETINNIGSFDDLRAPENNTYFNLSSGSLTQDWSTTGLITTNDNWSNVPSIEGYLGQDITTATGADPQTLLITSVVANDLDVIANQTNPNTNGSGGVAEFESTMQVAPNNTNPTVALQGSGTADAPYLIFYLNTTGRQNINIAYNLRDIDCSSDHAVQPVALQYRVGTSGNFTNVAAGFVADATTGPNFCTAVTAVSQTLPAAVNNQAQVQVRVITANAVGADEWVGVDDIVISSAAIPPTGTFDFSSATFDGSEATTPLNLAINRTNGSSGAVTVNYSFMDGTATGGAACGAGIDYVNTSGSVNFADAVTTANVPVTICNDSVFENNETFTVTITSVTAGASVGITQPSTTVTINNDDAAPSFAISDVTQDEGNSGGNTSFTFTVTKTGATQITSTVDFTTVNGTATAGSDYTVTSGTLTFLANETTMMITVLVNGDTDTEPDETFFVNLSNVSGATITDNQGIGTIRNDEVGSTGMIPAGIYTNLNVDTATLAGNVTVTGTLTIGNGVVTTSGNTLTLGESGTYTRGTGFVEGSFQKLFPATAGAGMFEFPVGTTVGDHDGYSPVTLSSITATASDGLTVTPDDAVLPQLTSGQSATRSWTLTETGSGNLRGILKFTYLPGDVVGTESTYKLYKVDGGILTLVPSTLVAPNMIQSNAVVDNFSPWGIGNAPTAAAVSISGKVIVPQVFGVPRVAVTLTDMQGNSQSVLANFKTGAFRFSATAGETYILSVTVKGYTYAPQVITANEDVTGISFEPID